MAIKRQPVNSEVRVVNQTHDGKAIGHKEPWYPKISYLSVGVSEEIAPSQGSRGFQAKTATGSHTFPNGWYAD